MTLVLCLFLIFSGMFLNYSNIGVQLFDRKTYNLSKIYLIIMMLCLFFLSGIRGDFTTDYINYDWLYQKGYPSKGIFELLREREFGFALINKLTYSVNSNTVALMLVVSAMTILCYYKIFEKFSKDYLISLVMMIVLDNYFISFNLMRNILACALFLLSSKLIINKKLPQYIISVFLISTIHKTAVLMLPMYWILRFDFRIKKQQAFPLICILGSVMFMCFFNEIVFFVQRLIGYNWDENGYGVGQGSIGSLIKTLFLFILVLLLMKKNNYSNIKERIWFNGCVFNVIFQFCSYRLFMMQRVGFYFSGFFLLLIPLLITKKKGKKRKLWKYVFVGFCILYAAFFCRDTIYYTFWNNKII